MPMHAGAAGKVFMAFDEPTLRLTLAQEGAETIATLANRTLLDRQLDEVRRRGYAFTEEERERGLNSLSAPVFDSFGRVPAALAVGAPAFRLTSEVADALGPVMLELSEKLSRQLGHMPETPASAEPAAADDRA